MGISKVLTCILVTSDRLDQSVLSQQVKAHDQVVDHWELRVAEVGQRQTVLDVETFDSPGLSGQVIEKRKGF